ncbi:MAG: N-acetyltransferase family protein [Candidatus Lokiarchaeia archaeon]
MNPSSKKGGSTTMETANEVYYYMSHDLKNLPSKPVNKNVKIRNLKKEDIPDYVNLVNEALSHSPDPFVPMTREFAEKWPLEQTLIAEYNGEMVGFLMFESRGKTGLPVQLGVAPKYRRLYIGTTLLITLLEKFKKEGIKEVQMKVYENNKPARSLYKKLNFKIYGIIIEH